MRNRLWALEIPSGDLRAFTHCGNRKIRLYDGGDGGGGGGNDAYGGSGDLAGSLGGGSFSGAGGGYSSPGEADQAAANQTAANQTAASQALADFENALATQDRGMSLAELAAALDPSTAPSTAPSAQSTVSAADIDANIDPSIDAALDSPTVPMDQAAAEAAMNAALNAPSNVLGSELAGGWQDSSGRGIVSQGMNISLGLDPTHGPIGPYAGTNPNAPNPEALNQVAKALDMPLDALLALAGRDEFGVRDPSQISTSGLDRGTLSAARDAGLGQLNLTDNQTVDQALAAFNVSDALDYAFPGLANAMVPGFSTLSSVSKALVGLHQGYLTPGQALAQIGLGLLSGKTNIPESALQQAFSGQYGPLAGGIAQSGLAGLIGDKIGVPSGLVNMGLGAAGVGKSVAGALSDLKGPDLLGPSLDSVGTTTASTDTGASTATGDAGGASGDTSGGASGDTSGGTSGDTTSGGSANPFGILGLAGLLGGSSGSKDEENKNAADVRRGIAMTPYGTLYGEQNV